MIGMLKHIIAATSLKMEDCIEMATYFELERVPKKTHFIAYGQPLEYVYFVLEGLMYPQYDSRTGDGGCVVMFLSDFEWVNPNFYDEINSGSLYDYFTIEKTTLVKIKKDHIPEMLQKWPELNQYFAKCLEYRSYKLEIAKISHSINISQGKYQMFRNSYEKLVDRIPLQLIASYLNMKPETLSRTRKKQES